MKTTTTYYRITRLGSKSNNSRPASPIAGAEASNDDVQASISDMILDDKTNECSSMNARAASPGCVIVSSPSEFTGPVLVFRTSDNLSTTRSLVSPSACQTQNPIFLIENLMPTEDAEPCTSASASSADHSDVYLEDMVEIALTSDDEAGDVDMSSVTDGSVMYLEDLIDMRFLDAGKHIATDANDESVTYLDDLLVPSSSGEARVTNPAVESDDSVVYLEDLFGGDFFASLEASRKSQTDSETSMMYLEDLLGSPADDANAALLALESHATHLNNEEETSVMYLEDLFGNVSSLEESVTPKLAEKPVTYWDDPLLVESAVHFVNDEEVRPGKKRSFFRRLFSCSKN